MGGWVDGRDGIGVRLGRDSVGVRGRGEGVELSQVTPVPSGQPPGAVCPD